MSVSSSTFPKNKIAVLKERATMLAKARAFFDQRNVFEVDCPLLSPSASVDAHINLISALYEGKEKRFLHSSPEYGMKRLLAEGSGDIFQLSHVFRDGEYGWKHNPEFTLVEWYRVGMAFPNIIEETLDFIRLFLGNLPSTILSYRECFQRYLNLDPFTASDAALRSRLASKPIRPASLEQESRDGLLNYLLALEIEPLLGINELTVIRDYPSSQAALAKTIDRDEIRVAERFEVYFKGYELANGYHELANACEQRLRLDEANQARRQMGKEVLPLDYLFLAALEKGLPDCCGVAVGFDRLMMLRLQKERIAEVLPMGWAEA